MRISFKRDGLKNAFVYSLSLVVLLIIPDTPGSGLDQVQIGAYLAVATILLVYHVTKEQSSNWLRPDIIFLISFFIVHYQWPLMFIASGLSSERSRLASSIALHGNYGTWISTIALAAWLAGFALTNPKKLIKFQKFNNIPQFTIAAIALLLVFALSVGSSFFSGTVYKELQTQVIQTVTGFSAYVLTLNEILTLILISMFFYPNIVKQHINSGKNSLLESNLRSWKNTKVLFLTYLAAYLLIFLVAGERGQVVQILSVMAVLYATHFRPIRLIELVALVALGALVMTAIGIIRSQVGDISIGNILVDYGLWGLTTNLANSSITLYQGIDLIYSGHDFYYGQLWLSQLLGLVPFLQSLFVALTGWSSVDINSSHAITSYILGGDMHTGFGTSFVIDIYLNFGVAGVVAASCIYGFLCKYANEWIKCTGGFNRFFASVAFTSLVFYAPRSSILFQLRPICWGFVIIFVFLRLRRVRV